MPPIVSATAAPTTNGPTRLKIVASTIAWPGSSRARGDQRGDRVRGIEQPVGDCEGKREGDRDREPDIHRPYLMCRFAAETSAVALRESSAPDSKRSFPCKAAALDG